MEDGGKKDKPQSPTQYYLSELGLNLDWHNNLLQFGPAVIVHSPIGFAY